MASRKGRESRYNQPGVTGRLTGVAMPTNVRRDEDGAENVDDFFASPSGSAVKGKSTARASAGSAKRKAAVSNHDARRGPRPDVHHELGHVGRKTGVQIHSAKRHADGTEDVADFFHSPTSKHPSSPSRRPSLGSRSVELGRKDARRRMTDQVPEDDLDEVDMTLDNDSGLTPPPYLNGASDSRRSRDAATPDSSARSRTHPGSSSPQPQRGATPSEDDDSDVGEPEGDLPDIAEDDEEEDEEEEAAPPSRRDKGKGRAPPSDDEQDFQDYGGGGGGGDDYGEAPDETMMEVDQNEDPAADGLSDIGSSSPPPRPRSPPPRKAPPTKKKAKSPTRSNPKKRQYTDEDASGLRRSSRPHEAPLAFWRNEKAVYKRRESGITLVDVIRTEPQPMRMPHHRKHGKGGASRQTSRARSTTHVKEDPDAAEEGAEDYAEWDVATDAEGLVWDYVDKKEKRRRIAYTAAMIRPNAVARGAYKFEKIFSDGEYMAGGILEIPVGSKKPIKPARDNSYMLYVERGAVQVLIYRTYFPIARGGFFFVPRGNSYEIENIGQVPVRLVFAQAREVKVAVDPDADSDDEGMAAYDYEPGMEGDASVFLPPVDEEDEEAAQSEEDQE